MHKERFSDDIIKQAKQLTQSFMVKTRNASWKDFRLSEEKRRVLIYLLDSGIDCDTSRDRAVPGILMNLSMFVH